MFAGHLGAGLILKQVNPSVNLGVFFLAALFLDVMLWVFILLGIESIRIPADFQQRHYLTFFFPYSHGLVSSLFWSLSFGLVCYWLLRTSSSVRRRTAFILVITVFSHFILDFLVHVPEMPVWGRTSHPLGLGLWNHLPLALGLETLIALTGTYLWLRDSKRTFPRRLTLGLLMGLVTAMTVVGPWLQKSPPAPFQVAISSLTIIFLLFGAGIWIDRKSVGL
jgi:hypothetical protein